MGPAAGPSPPSPPPLIRTITRTTRIATETRLGRRGESRIGRVWPMRSHPMRANPFAIAPPCLRLARRPDPLARRQRPVGHAIAVAIGHAVAVVVAVALGE